MKLKSLFIAALVLVGMSAKAEDIYLDPNTLSATTQRSQWGGYDLVIRSNGSEIFRRGTFSTTLTAGDVNAAITSARSLGKGIMFNPADGRMKVTERPGQASSQDIILLKEQLAKCEQRNDKLISIIDGSSGGARSNH